MSDPTLLVLASLADGEKHGYAMMEDIERFAGVSGIQLQRELLGGRGVFVLLSYGGPAGGRRTDRFDP